MRTMQFVLMSVISIALYGCGDSKGGSTETASDSMTSGETDDATGGEPTGATEGACEGFAGWISMCDPEAGTSAEIVAQCEDMRAEYPACATQFDAQIKCMADAKCDDEAACAQEIQAYYECLFPVGEVCEAYGAKETECAGSDEMAGASCQALLDELKESDPAYEQYFACYAELSCDEIATGLGCEAEADGLSACD